MYVQQWFNKMSKGDLGRPLRGNVTLYREPAIRCFAKWCSDVCLYGLAHLLHYMAHAVGGSRWWRCDLWCIICMSSSAWLERKQWASHRQTGQKKSVCLRQKTTKKKTVIHVSHKAPDTQSDLHEKQGSVRRDQCKSSPFVVFTQQKWTIFIRGPREASLSSACAAATQPAELCYLFSAPSHHLTVAPLKSWPALHVV